tara:strand:- start:13715 stop:14446 length:732 start_codon:yes stop_codon:yes gene_type:complete
MKFIHSNYNAAAADGSIQNDFNTISPTSTFLGCDVSEDDASRKILALHFKDHAGSISADSSEILFLEVNDSKVKEALTDISRFFSNSKGSFLDIADAAFINKKVSPHIVGIAPAPFTVTAVNSGGATITTIAKTGTFRFDLASANSDLDSSAEVGTTCQFSLSLVGSGTGDDQTFTRSSAISGNEADGTTLISTASGNATNVADLSDFDPDNGGSDDLKATVTLTTPGGGSRSVSTTIDFTDS